MLRKIFLSLISAVSFLFLFSSCSSTSVYDKVYPTLNDGKYDSEFPYRNSSTQLEEISNSIKLINSIAFYESYVFDEKSKIRASDIRKINFGKEAVEKVFFNRSASGTATIILEDQGAVALLTVSHIVSFPDTILSFFVNPDGSLSTFVQSISVKSRQTNYVPDLPDNGELEILIMDKNRDLALMGRKYSPLQTKNLPVFKYPWGKSAELEWGSFVYVFGFPMNYKMVSKGIVSSPGKDKNQFLIDAVFNRGYSGGIVLAIRDGVPNFELVGLVRSVPADYEYVVRPVTKETDLDYNPRIPYKGDVYVEKQQVLRTGITKVIGIESVLDFILDNKNILINSGYFFRDLYNAPASIKMIK